MDLKRYLERIRYDGSLDLTLPTLRALQRSTLLSVPFENLDIHIGRHIEFTPEALYRKIVIGNRGGFCYELNSFFFDLLTELGFRTSLAAASMFKDGKPGMPMGHLVLIVEIEGERWLTDVGNGKSFREPLNLNGTTASSAEGVTYRVASIQEGAGVVETDKDGSWKPRFVFDPQPRRREEFIPMCEWTQTSPESRFTRNRLCTIARPDGRITLMNDTLTIDQGGASEERKVTAGEYENLLWAHFGIRLND